MAVFTVNGKTVTAEKNQKLLRFLRDELRLTSVKDGCSEGACGTCTVLIDGKPTKACVPQTDKLEGKNILTVEGLSDWEKKVYTWAFGEAGAVQCGFCIPGMVISAKALLDTNPDPSREEAAFAIRNNICRCTGYVRSSKPSAWPGSTCGPAVCRQSRKTGGWAAAYPASMWRKRCRNRHLSGRRVCWTAMHPRQRRPQQILPRPGAGHPHGSGESPSGRGGRVYGRGTFPASTRLAIWSRIGTR